MKHLLIIAALFISSIGFAQSATEEVDLIQSLYGMEKKEIVADFIKLDGTQGSEFWKLYDAYEVERKSLGKERINLLEDYAMHYGTLDDAKTDELINKMISLGAKTDKLIATYYKKMKKPAGVKAAAQFVQIEQYLLSSVRAAILEEIPFIGELD
jgi:Spy/CpxP family protein refolding chaperone